MNQVRKKVESRIATQYNKGPQKTSLGLAIEI